MSTVVAEAPVGDGAAAPPAPPTPTLGAAGAPPVSRREAVALVVGGLGLAIAVIATRWGVFAPDTRPDLYQDPGGFLRASVQAWVPGASGLGQGNFNAGAAPVAAVVWLIRTLGAPPWLAVRLWRLLVLLLGAWGLRRYLDELLGSRLSPGARLLGTAFWVLNPYVIVSGSTTPILLPYALLPWMLLAFLRATRSPRSWRWPAAFGLAFFAQSGLNAGVVPFFGLLALPAHVAHAHWIEGRSWRDLVRVVVRSGVCALAVSLYWLAPSLLAAGTGTGIAGGTEDPLDVARTSSYAESARLLGNWPLYGRSGDRAFLGDYTVYLTSAWVVVATFLVPLGAAVAMWRVRARERLLVAGLLLFGLPVMVGIFPPDDPSPFGRFLQTLFEDVGPAIAFRTTNKVGAVVVLAETIALVVGWRWWQLRSRDRGRVLRRGADLGVAVLALSISVPLWSGGLYPLGYEIPDTWQQATGDLDAGDAASRVLVLPGGTGGNYRWGMRSPDDLFPSLLARPVAVRNTVVGRGDPAGNFLSLVDVAVADQAVEPGTVAAVARYLGAGDVLVRSDLLTEEIGGPEPWVVVDQADDDVDLELAERYGRRGTDTIPGSSGPATRRDRRRDPANAAVHPLRTYAVDDALPVVRAAPAADQVLVAGDGGAFAQLVRAGIADGRQPVRYLAELDDAAFAEAVAQGGRVVLTDSNRRRAWDINRTGNATSPTLTVEEDVDGGNGATVTLWPDEPDHQSVAELSDEVVVGADRPGFGLTPFGRPSNAFDGDPNTAWTTGGFGTAAGATVWIELPEPVELEEVTITPFATEPSRIAAVRVEVGDKRTIEAMGAPGAPVPVRIEPTEADRVAVTILTQTPGNNPVGIAEIDLGIDPVRNVTRTPRTLALLADDADPATLERLAQLPFDVVLSRARGSVRDLGDDEESQLDRRFELPQDRTFAFTAELAAEAVDPAVVAAARAGDRPCLPVALLDDEPVEAAIASSAEELADGLVRLEGCEELELEAGAHELQTVYGWRLDQARFASAGIEGPGGDGRGDVEVTDRTATRVDATIGPGDGDRWVRLGEAYDPRWRLSVDGVDAGPPEVIDGYAAGWSVDGDAHDLRFEFAPQRAVELTFVASAAAVVVVTAVAVLPAPAALRRRRRTRAAEAGAGDGGIT